MAEFGDSGYTSWFVSPRPLITACVAALCVSAQGLSSEDPEWGRFRGPNGAGVSQARGLPDDLDPEGIAAEADYAFADDFVCALDEDRPHTCSGAEGRHVMEIMMGIFESAAQGRRIALPQVDRGHPLLKWREDAGLGLPGQMPRPYKEWLEAEDRRLGRR